MKERWFWVKVLVLGSLLLYPAFPAHAQKFPKVLTLAYSNNMNSEIDPCPT